MGDLSKHFNRYEFRQPAAYGLPEEPYPEELVATMLRPLVYDVLEPLRLDLGRPLVVIVGGGWRSREWQRRHGGVAHTRHSEGDAADVSCEGYTGQQLHDIVYDMWIHHRLPALGGLGLYVGREFTHVDCRPHAPGELARWP